MIKYLINNKTISIKPHQFEGKQSKEYYENQIENSFSKIGITKENYEINTNTDEFGSHATLKWQINSNTYLFKCSTQKDETANLGAIAQAVTEDIRQITRGIKDLHTLMTQYKTKEPIKKKTNLFKFTTTSQDSNTERLFPSQENKIDTPVNEELDIKYSYLKKYTNSQLDSIYLKMKEECSKKNLKNHPLLKALKIVRQKRGLNL